MSEPTFGFTFRQDDVEVRPPSKAEMSVIGLQVTAPKKASGIEYHTPYAINSTDHEFIKSLGTEGTACDAIDAINDQMGDFQVSAKLVINVAPESKSTDKKAKVAETMANLKGDSATGTGIHAFKQAAQKLGRTPRIISVPGYTHQVLKKGQANPVVAELPGVLSNLLAVGIIDGPCTNRQDAIDWRETFSSKRLIPVETAVLVQDGTDSVRRSASPRIAGLLASVDHSKEGYPFHSAANRPVQGIVGPARNIDFSLTDGSTEAQELLKHNMGVILRGEAGDDSGIAGGGFVYVGTDTASEDPLWRFYNQVRGRDYIHITALRTLRFFLGRYNLTGHVIEAYTNTLRAILSDLKAGNHIIGYKVGFSADQNTPEDLRSGKLTVEAYAEEPAPFVHGRIISKRYRFALEEMVGNLVSQLNQLSA